MNPLQPFALPPMSIFNSDLTLLRILLDFKFPAFRAECLASIWLEYTYFMESGQAKLPGRSERGPNEQIVPISALWKNFRNEKYIPT
jgi:hypothetical protein